MRAVIQRVNSASVVVENETVGAIDRGLLVLLGVSETDTEQDAIYLAQKIPDLRCFSDSDGKFNLSLLDIGGSMLAVSQFTLFGDCRKGKRPSFTEAARPELAVPLYEDFVQLARARGIHVETGKFGAHMDVHLINSGPVTLLVDSRKAF
jgi:D-tyrosyl-tRNA(Tyr) deacylase